MQDKTYTIGRFKDTTPEAVDASAGRGYLVSFLKRNGNNPHLSELVQAIEEHIDSNPISRSKQLGPVGTRVSHEMMLLEAEWKTSEKNDKHKTIKHVFSTQSGDVVIIYSNLQAIQSVNIQDTVTISGTIKKVVPIKHRGIDDDMATILENISIKF